MHKGIVLAASFGLALVAAPAHATGGLQCRTADRSALVISLGFGHVPGAPIIASRLSAKGRTIPVSVPQWWFDGKEMRAVLTDPDALKTIATLRTTVNGQFYDGTVDWQGKRRWVRCRED